MTESGNKFYGLYRGVVVTNDDTSTGHPYLGRVQVSVPQVYGEEVPDEDLPWASPSFPYGGGRYKGAPFGLLFVPPVGASVWVAFEQGDPAHPVVLGAWLGEKDASPEAPPEFVEGYPMDVILHDTTGQDGMYIRFVKGQRIELIAQKDRSQIILNRGGDIDIKTYGGKVNVQTDLGDIQVQTQTGRVRIVSGLVTFNEDQEVVTDTLQFTEIRPSGGASTQTDHYRKGGPIETSAEMRIVAKNLLIQASNITFVSENNFRISSGKGTYNSSEQVSGFDTQGGG